MEGPLPSVIREVSEEETTNCAPTFVDIFSGPNAPVGSAMAMIGWTVTVVEWELDYECDLRKPSVQSKTLEVVKRAAASMIALPCGSLTRAREKPIPGHPNPPKPLRDANNVRGLPGLAGRELEAVADGNATTDWSLYAADVADQVGSLVVLENPVNSWVRKFPKAKSLCAKPNWHQAEYPACAYFAARCKFQWLAANFEEIELLNVPNCLHLHDKDEWKPFFNDDTQSWFYPSSQEAEYTASLAFSLAVAFTMAACRLGKASMSIPRMPAREATGCRCGWSKFDSRALRQWLMVVQAKQIGLQPLQD